MKKELLIFGTIAFLFLSIPSYAITPVERKGDIDQQTIEAANEGDADAQYSLGMLEFFKAFLTDQNYTLAVEWFSKAAEQDHTKTLSFLNALCGSEIEEIIKIRQTESLSYVCKSNKIQEYQYEVGKHALMEFKSGGRQAEDIIEDIFIIGATLVITLGVVSIFTSKSLIFKFLNILRTGEKARNLLIFYDQQVIDDLQ